MDDQPSIAAHQHADTTESLLILQSLKGLGTSGLHTLLNQFGSAKKILQLDQADLYATGNGSRWTAVVEQILAIQCKRSSHPIVIEVQQQRERCAQQGIAIIPIFDRRYPKPLRHIHHPPLVLYVKGDVNALNKPLLAIVGARKASQAAQQHAYNFAHQLAQAGLVICSGLAVGVDSCAHLGALAAKQQTVAVMAHGLDHIYPRSNAKLFEQAFQQGACISEFAPGITPRREFFPRRNRLISGLSLGVCIIEAARNSGSLITARCAIEQNRELFALPSSISDAKAAGCHYLIQQGANLVTSTEDILQHLNIALSMNVVDKQPSANLNPELLKMLSEMPYQATHFDTLATQFQLPTEQLSAQLMQLEMAGEICHEHSLFWRI